VVREVVCGEFHSGHRMEWTELVRKEIGEGRGASWLYLVPTRGLGAAVRELALKGLDGMAGEQVLTLFEVVERTLKCSGKPYVRLDSLGAERLVAKVLRGKTGVWNGVPLRDWAHSPGVVAAFREHIAELRRAMVSPGRLMELVDGSGHEENLKVLAEVYAGYEEALRSGEFLLLDTEESYLEAARILKERGLDSVFPGVDRVFVDSYTDFLPHQMEVVMPLLKAAEVRVYLPYQMTRWEWMESLAGLMRKTVDRLVAEAGLQVRYAEADASAGAGVKPDLLEVQARMFAPHPAPVLETPSVKAFCARTEEKEWLWVAKRIKELHRSGVPLSEIAVLCNREIQYGSVGHRVLKREGIPISQNVALSADQVPWVRDLLTLYTLEDADWHRDTLLQLACAKWLLGENVVPPAVLQKVAKQLGVVKGLEVWRERLAAEIARWNARVESLRGDGVGHFAAEDEFGTGVPVDFGQDEWKEGLQKLGDLQAVLAWIERLAEKVQGLPEEADGAGHAEALRALMPGAEFDRRLALRYREKNGYGMEHLQRDLQAREKVEQVLCALEKLEAVLGEEGPYSREEFVQLLHGHLRGEEIVVERGKRGGVQVLNPSAARGLSFAHVFFVGLNEGVWPAAPAAPWLISERLRVELAKQMPLFSPQVEADQQKLFFLMGLHTAREGVWLSFVGGSKQDLASRFLDELLELCPAVKEGMDADGYLGGSALYPAEQAAVSNLREARDWTAAILLSAEALDVVEPEFWRQVAAQAMSERERANGAGSCRFDGVLGDSGIRAELAERFSEETVYSVSQFNRYGECGYKFFLSRVLMLEGEQEESEELSALEKGNLYHRVLHRLYGQVTAEERMTPELVQSLRGQVAVLFEEEWTKAQQARMTQVGVRQLLEKERLLRRLQEWFEVESKAWMEMGLPLVPRYLEWAFGMRAAQGDDPRSQREPVTVGKLKFRGKIDRVDATADGKFVVVDYKTKHAKPMPKAIEQGIDFQLPVYVKAVEQALFADGTPVGAAYFSIEKGDRTSSALVKEEFLEALGMGKKRTKLDDESWEELFLLTEQTLSRYREQMASGVFAVLPSDEAVCAHCEYRRVCRYDRLRALGRAVTLKKEGVRVDG
jgi:ATP-dependent helicase/nuclease subunit B